MLVPACGACPGSSPESSRRDPCLDLRPPFPTHARTHTSLQALYVGKNNVRDVAGIESLTQLEVLELSFNALTSVCALSFLMRDVHGWPGCSVGDWIYSVCIFASSSDKDKFSTRVHTQLPPGFSALQRLEVLVLSDNPLSAFPLAVCSLPHLRTLKINRCTRGKASWALPDEIGRLTALEILEADNNRIDSVPASIGNLAHLARLSLRSNSLTTYRRRLAPLFCSCIPSRCGATTLSLPFRKLGGLLALLPNILRYDRLGCCVPKFLPVSKPALPLVQNARTF